MQLKIFLMLSLITAGHLYGQTADKVDKVLTDAEIEIELKKMITPLMVAEKLKIQFPPVNPTVTVDEIEKKLLAEVQKKVDEKYPLNTRDLAVKEAQQKYILYKKGDMVNDLRIRPAGRDSVISGIYQGVNKKGEHVVGKHVISAVDMKEDILVMFDPELNKTKIATFIRNRLLYFEEDRAKLKAKLTEELAPVFYQEAGYFTNNGKFYKAADYLKEMYEAEKAQLKKKLTTVAAAPKVEEKKKEVKDPLAEVDPLDEVEEKKSNVSETQKVENLPKRPKVYLFGNSFYEPKK